MAPRVYPTIGTGASTQAKSGNVKIISTRSKYMTKKTIKQKQEVIFCNIELTANKTGSPFVHIKVNAIFIQSNFKPS